MADIVAGAGQLGQPARHQAPRIRVTQPVHGYRCGGQANSARLAGG
jgi:hypothetical protein